jgi:hypothetical protein
MNTSRFKDRRDAILESAAYVAEEEFIQRNLEVFKQSDRYKEYIKRKEAEKESEIKTETQS